MFDIKEHLQKRHNYRLSVLGWSFVIVTLVSAVLVANIFATDHILSIDGYLGDSYDTLDKRRPTGEIAESKLWWNDGSWWGNLYNNSAQEYQIYRLDWPTQKWESTGVTIDNRKDSRADALWDETTGKLYVASHYYAENPRPRINHPQDWARLYRFSYDMVTQSYSLDDGFPTIINYDRTETLVLDKDSTGRLWVTYVSREGGASEYQVYVNSTDGDDSNWATPFTLPFPEAYVDLDDITSLIAFSDEEGPKIGIFWSNQLSQYDAFYFAIHRDHDEAQSGWQLDTNLDLPYPADDHINLATTTSGQVLAVVKTEATLPSDPLIIVVARETNGAFSYHPVSLVSSSDNRPILVIDEDSNQAYVFASSSTSGGSICYFSAVITSPLANMSFPIDNCIRSGTNGAPKFIGDTIYNRISNVTSSKQNATAASGLVVLASDDVNGSVYVHNYLGGEPVLPVASFAADPNAGQSPLVVTFSDMSIGEPTSWLWDFGDGETAVEQNPVHTYTNPGEYTVTLTATNAVGFNTHTKQQYISVSPPLPTFTSFLPMTFRSGPLPYEQLWDVGPAMMFRYYHYEEEE